MEYIRVSSIEDPLFKMLYKLMQKVFPPEEVLEFHLWKEPLEDPGIRVFVAYHNGEVVGATEYRYYDDLNVAMTDFTIIGQEELGIGRFLANKRMQDLQSVAASYGNQLFGMFVEIYNPYRVDHLSFGSIIQMDPFVRREVLSYLGYRRLNFSYVHPSWKNDGETVTGLDLCFLTMDDEVDSIPSALIVDFLVRYYAVLSNRPDTWYRMVEDLKSIEGIQLLPI
jgi:hypothetical protein